MEEVVRKEASNVQIARDSVVSRDVAAASIKKLITSVADKPYSLSIEMKGDTLSITGYSNITDIRAPSFLIHRHGNGCEVGFAHPFAVDICKKSGFLATDNNIITALTKHGGQKRLSDIRFDGVVAAFSAISDAKININHQKKLTSDATYLDLTKKDYREQYRIAVNLAKLIEECKRQAEEGKLDKKDIIKNAIRDVLETSDTIHVIKACEEYFSFIECSNAYVWQNTEALAKGKLENLIKYIKSGNDPAKVLDKSIKEISAICQDNTKGRDLSEIWIKREIVEYNKSVEEDRKRVNSPADVSSWEEGSAKEQVKMREAEYKQELNDDIKVRSLLEDALTILQKKRGSNEPNKP